MGKLLRFNDDGTPPADNPFFATQTGLARAVWASGLRNPFTFAVRPSEGRLHVNDIGQNTWEEINLGAPGASCGGPATEGPTNASGVTAPQFARVPSPSASSRCRPLPGPVLGVAEGVKVPMRARSADRRHPTRLPPSREAPPTA